MRTLALLFVIALLAGCADGAGGGPRERAWDPLRCDHSGVSSTAETARLVAGLQGAPEIVAQRVAGAFGEEMVGEPTVETLEFVDAHGRPGVTLKSTWALRSGEVVVQSTAGSVLLVELVRGAPYLDDAVEAWVPTLGVDTDTLVQSDPFPDSAPRSGRLEQRWGGRQVGVGLNALFGITWGGGGGLLEGPANLVVGQLFDFLIEAPRVSEENAVAAGSAFSACEVADRGWTVEAGFRVDQVVTLGVAVWDESIAYLVHIGYAAPGEGLPCGPGHWVYIDVYTGAVLRHMDPPCE